MIYRLILPEWACAESPGAKKILEGEFTDAELAAYNGQGYNIHYMPNYPSVYDGSKPVDGADIDVFNWIFVDLDMKDYQSEDPKRRHDFATKDDFIVRVLGEEALRPTTIIDSGHGIHVYWKVTDLDAMSFLKLQRRLMHHFTSDKAVAKIFQLMRPSGFVNTKNKDAPKLCELLFAEENEYTCEQVDAVLPPLTHACQTYCEQHFNKTYRIGATTQVNDTVPAAFNKLLRENKEVKEIWVGNVGDRSTADFRLGRIMHGHGFTRDEAMSVLVNTAKALQRAPIHRVSYAENIVEKIWPADEPQSVELSLSSSVKDILAKGGDTLKGARIPCSIWYDNTEHGFRRGHVMGLVAGSKIGKTAFTLDMFGGFVQNNPDLEHFFIPLEQPGHELADRWKTWCGTNTHLHDKVHVLSNYDDQGGFRHLSLDNIRVYLEKWQKLTGKKIGCVVIDHIGVLKKGNADGRQSIEDICHMMKAFAVQLDVFLIMQSQAPREKAGIGDLELNKDAAYGTVFFESYCDYLVTLWQPLKRQYGDAIFTCPTVTAYKFCAIRHKKQGKDIIKEDVCYRLFFDPETARFRQLTQAEDTAFDFHNNIATNKRKQDRRTELVSYVSIKTEGTNDGEINNYPNVRGSGNA